MPAVVPLVGIGAGLYGAKKQSDAAKGAAKAQQQATDAQIAEQRRQYDQSRQDQMPFLQAGYDALARQQRFLDGDYSQALASPDYLARLEWGQKGLDRGAAARGNLFSGGYDADRMKFNADMATEGINTYWNRLAGRAGQGQVTASGLGALGANMAGNIGAALQNNANARASSYLQQGNIAAQTAAGVGGIFANWYQNNSANNGGGSGWYLGSRPGPG